MLQRFADLSAVPAAPAVFPSPFSNSPHPLARHAAQLLMQQLQGRLPEADVCGRMAAVLVVRDGAGQLGWLAGLSGEIPAGADGFVPPIDDSDARQASEVAAAEDIAVIDAQISAERESAAYRGLLQQIARLETLLEADLQRLQTARERNRIARKAARAQALAEGDKAAEAALNRASRAEREAIRQCRREGQAQLAAPQAALADCERRLEALQTARRRRLALRDRQCFDHYRLRDFRGGQPSLRALYRPSQPLPGSGDCAEPRLLHYAATRRWQPLAMASFWWGASPAAEVRHHGRFYPACRGRCGPLLPAQLSGVETEPMPRMALYFDASEPVVIYEDETIVVADKPSGMLSVPGKRTSDSVVTRLQARYGSGTEIMAVHRLDMSTSGVMLLAKSLGAFVHLQKQFSARQVSKRYEAILDGTLRQAQGEISLPLRTDFADRPRQVVCDQHGKAALTRWQRLALENGRSRVAFFPHTGRTHQLRLHAAHPRGLGLPILGDELYGLNTDLRLHLHACELRIRHPQDGRALCFSAATPF
ncbi:RluA family pseudouridine synthase [Granulosicoccaceae sp. 1_MG-2023]|nr:RluA family pseudouridine synthase [Granulosicoccaceae sp. 1_MG-2023]